VGDRERARLVEADAVRFWVVPLPATIELTDPEEIAMVLDAGAPYADALYTAVEAIAQLRAETDKA
jgi:hypothetical protein